MDVSKTLTENTDEILALGTVIPIVLALIYLSIIGKVDPAVVLTPLATLVLGYYFRKASEPKT